MKAIVEGHILHQVPYKEHQLALTILTKTGKQTIFLRKPSTKNDLKDANLTLGAKTRFHLVTKNTMTRVQASELISHPLGQLSSLPSLLGFEALLEVTLKWVQEEDAASIYEPFEDALQMMGQQPLVALNEYMRHLLTLNGISLTLHQCVSCDSKKGIYSIDANQGGFVCKPCAQKLSLQPVRVEQLTFIRDFYRYGPRLGILKEALILLLKLHYEHGQFYLQIDLPALENFMSIHQSHS